MYAMHAMRPNNNYSPYSRTKINAACVSYKAHIKLTALIARRCTTLLQPRDAPRQTDGRTDTARFYPRDAMLARVLLAAALCPCLCLSVCHKSVFY